MYQIDFKKPVRVHFIGIGGISMSGLAEILMDEGFSVSGSDMKNSALTEGLASKGARIDIGQRAENIRDPELVVYTAAIHPDNPEYAEAVRRGIPMLSRAQLLGEIMSNYKEAINIAGTHGKTTTTSMLSEILIDAEKDPTVSVGGLLDAIGGNLRNGGKDFFVAEACEYTNSFLSFNPTVAVILNVEADHLDFFKDIDDIRHSFREFARTLPQDERGFLIINGDIRDLEYFTGGLGCGYVTFGIGEKNDYSASNISFDDLARPSFDIIRRGERMGHVELKVHGGHNITDALAAAAAADRVGVSFDIICGALSSYEGVKRRFEHKGRVNGCDIVDDYAHHPQEIEATLKAAAGCRHRHLYVVFQPHTYTRTKALINEFAAALSKADTVILADIYAAREVNTLGISSEELASLVNKEGGNAVYIPDFEKIKKYILETVGEGDLLITMGAGNVVDIANQLTE
ncbi:MAG: UDP-N-acetylmuramate--L-alanine ligase [Eubacteriales bacterium]|nr:UDP-N-acetylmuramate--L-alanine ligase [Eubacteriales bacterium]